MSAAIAEGSKRIVPADHAGVPLRVQATESVATDLAIAPHKQQQAYLTDPYGNGAVRKLWAVSLAGGSPRKLAVLGGDAGGLAQRP